ncbi:MAG: PaaI family thioesterase [Gammaproteobacteria bacterium]|nr:PaaI family thioesterase [Gammaproteobacteria bacterium]
MTHASFYDAVRTRFTEVVPHVRECGMIVDHLSAEYAQARLPYRPEWLGDSERRLIHTGIITTVIDTVSGLAVLAALGQFEPIATLDLRMDYLRPTLPDKPLHCRAECYRVTRHICFVRACAWQDDEKEPVAVSQSTFMRSSHSRQRSARTI